jgi:hypothetical protein
MEATMSIKSLAVALLFVPAIAAAVPPGPTHPSIRGVVRAARASRASDRVYGYRVEARCGAAERIVHTRADGAFALNDVPAGRCAVQVTAMHCYHMGQRYSVALDAPAGDARITIPVDAPGGIATRE